MKKNNVKIRILIVMVLFAFTFGLSPAAHAEDMNVVACMKGAINGRFASFGQFLLDQISFDGLLGDIIDPWQDAIFANQCHAYDLFALTDRRNQIEAAIRDAYLSCKFTDLEVQKKMYDRITAEIYYVRNVVDRYKLFWMPNILKYALYDKYIANTKLDPQKNHTQIKQAFMKKFKKRFPDQKELDQLYYDISSKYSAREATYIVCDENPMIKVWTKMVEFGQFWGFVPGGESLWDKADEAWDANVGAAAKDVVSYGTELGKMFGIGGNAADAWLAHLSMNVNGVDIAGLLASDPSIVDATKEEFEEMFGDEAANVMDQVQAFKDSVEARGNNQEAFTEAFQSVSDRQKANDFRRNTSARNEVEYLFSDANSFIFIQQLTRLDQAINDSYAALDAVKSCSEKVNED